MLQIRSLPVQPWHEPAGHAVQLSEEIEPETEVNPAAQSMHVADPRAELAYLPAAHNPHDDRPDSPLVLVPVGQLSQEVPPNGAYVPASQLAHSPLDNGTVPEEHIQALDPGEDTIPVGQSMHTVDPAELEYLPTGHGAYVEAPTKTS